MDDITPLILTLNEAPNIGRALEKLSWAKRIVVVDSFSTDETEAICRRFPQVEFVQRRFDDHTAQWNFGLEQIKTGWVLSLDADYTLDDELLSGFKKLQPADDINAYFARFRYCIYGRALRSTLYPPRAVLFNRQYCRYESDGHTQLLAIRGGKGWLPGTIFHDDRKPLERWFGEQLKYSAIEARHLHETPVTKLNRVDRLRRKIVFAPFAVLFYTLVVRGLVFDGWPGWFYSFQRLLAELLLSLRLIEAKLKTTDH